MLSILSLYLFGIPFGFVVGFVIEASKPDAKPAKAFLGALGYAVGWPWYCVRGIARRLATQ